jgi:hypothetical protein
MQRGVVKNTPGNAAVLLGGLLEQLLDCRAISHVQGTGIDVVPLVAEICANRLDIVEVAVAEH